jgi:hypothetical protein
MNSEESEGSAWTGLKLLLRAFAVVPNNWLVLVRNLIPVIGVYFFAWSAPVTVLSYWWDGVTLLALLVGAVVLRVAFDESKSAGIVKRVAQGVIGWIIVFGMFGIPYWMAFGGLQMDSAAYAVLHDRGHCIAFLAILAGNSWSGMHKGFLTISDAQLKQRAQSGLHTLIVRAVLMMLMTTWGFGMLLIPAMALILTATEVWPAVLTEVIRYNKLRLAESA